MAPLSMKAPSANLLNEGTLHNFQTPAWSDFLQQEQSSLTDIRAKSRHDAILQKLNQFKQANLAHSSFTKIKLPEGFQTSRVRIVQTKQENHITPLRQKQKVKNQQQSTSRGHTKNISSSRKRSPVATGTSLTASNISAHQVRAGTIVKNVTSKSRLDRQTKRFNQITVHEHLYLDGRRMQAKRTMQQMLQQQYNRKYVMPFKPKISAVSQELAQHRFSRLQQRNKMEKSLERQMDKVSRVNTKVNRDELRERRSQNRYKVLNNLFYFLSANGQLITEQTLKQRLQQLPLVCIRLLQKYIKKVYKGERYSWLDFIGVINDKRTIENKEALLTVFEKWQERRNKRQRINQAKQNSSAATHSLQ